LARTSGVEVTEHRPFGIIATIAGVAYPGLIQITDFKDSGRMTPAEYPTSGSEVEAVVLGFHESNKQIWLGVRPSQLSNRKGC
jgi:ribosomal protein S1